MASRLCQYPRLSQDAGKCIDCNSFCHPWTSCLIYGVDIELPCKTGGSICVSKPASAKTGEQAFSEPEMVASRRTFVVHRLTALSGFLPLVDLGTTAAGQEVDVKVRRQICYHKSKNGHYIKPYYLLACHKSRVTQPSAIKIKANVLRRIIGSAEALPILCVRYFR